MPQKLIVIGNGMAAGKLLEELKARVDKAYDITVFGEEPHGNYNRILLSPVLAGEKTLSEIMINDRQWYQDNDIELRTNEKVVAINTLEKTVQNQHGEKFGYDTLIIATGSMPVMLPFPGIHLPGVITFRDVKDVDSMISAAEKGGNAIVIGGGLLGLEAANGLLKRGMKVTVIHNMPFLMNRQLDEPAAALLKRALESRQLDVRCNANTSEIVGTDHVQGVRMADGEHIRGDLVVMAVGIRPNTVLAKEAGLECARGILVDAEMRTSNPHIFSIGECVEFNGEVFGLVAPLYDQAKALAKVLVGEAAAYSVKSTATKLKVTGIDLFSAGDFAPGDDRDEIVLQDPAMGVYKKIVLKDNKIIGSVLYGDTSDGAWYFQLMKDEADVSSYRDVLAFGQAYLSADKANSDTLADLPDSAEICGCNGVCKGTILQAIKEKNLSSIDEVRLHTKASSSCGSCTGAVESLLKSAVGTAYQALAGEKSICACVSVGHDLIRTSIAEKSLKSIADVFAYHGWRTPSGCHVCRPAVNYYLLCEWPDEYQDDGQSRFTNERVHANIQKDNTYTVVPRMWGGLTNAKELRAIADAADKYQVPMVKVTGGQRIDLVGLKKEQLPHIWKDLTEAGFVSGHAYAKALRTVKTCIGKEFCRFGTQNSTDMGVRMEKLTWGSWTPAKVKMAVSGCPRNCAEATIKDLGVVAVDSGWELHVGGNGGIKVRVTDFLTKVETEDEVLEYTGAFMQLYREEARYGERTAHWLDRVGVEFVKKHLVDDQAQRFDLYQRFLASQQQYQKDPWAERVEKTFNHNEFIPVKEIV